MAKGKRVTTQERFCLIFFFDTLCFRNLAVILAS